MMAKGAATEPHEKFQITIQVSYLFVCSVCLTISTNISDKS